MEQIAVLYTLTVRLLRAARYSCNILSDVEISRLSPENQPNILVLVQDSLAGPRLHSCITVGTAALLQEVNTSETALVGRPGS
jgi:hypothetical protein